tara:strand:+ start:246 stop:500 length:255 start_codon:yes stop_codon:yes gene_type:complete
MEKTFKRELAIALIVWLVYIVEVKDVQIIEILVWPIFSYVTAAFGLDAYGKLQQKPPQSPHGRGTERSSQHPDRQREHPDYRGK